MGFVVMYSLKTAAVFELCTTVEYFQVALLSNPRWEHLLTEPSDEHYIVNWLTKEL